MKLDLQTVKQRRHSKLVKFLKLFDKVTPFIVCISIGVLSLSLALIKLLGGQFGISLICFTIAGVMAIISIPLLNDK